MQESRKLVENSSIHGIRYIFKQQVSKYTRLFWIVALLASIIGLVFNNYSLYQKLSETPDINVRTKRIFLNKIPFPAITVCTPLFAKNQLGRFYFVSKNVRKPSNVTLDLTIDDQNHLASNIHACYPEFGFNIKPHVENRTDNNIMKLLDQSSLQLSEALINCNYRVKVTNCSYLFNRVLTDRGFCYSFNLQSFNTIFNEKVISKDFHSYKRTEVRKSMYLHNKLIEERLNDSENKFEWSLETGYVKNHEADSVPIKAEKSKYFSFNPYLKERDLTNVCTQIGNVFSFFIHPPNEIMLPVHQEYYIEFKKKRDIVLIAKSFKADEGMRKFTPVSRGCYFEGEKQLKFFKTYTKAHCEFECMTNYTLNECGCVKFSMPRSSNTPICTVDKAQCYFEAMMRWPDYEKAKDRDEATCGCLKTCSDIKYEIKYDKISSADNVMFVYDMYNFSKEDAVSRIAFIFNDFEIFEYEEYAAYKLQNFVADVGGLLGFFLGCSILSLIEIFYFIFDSLKNQFNSFLQIRKDKKFIKEKVMVNHIKVKSIDSLAIQDSLKKLPNKGIANYRESMKINFYE